MNFNDEKSPILIRVCPVYIGSDEANKRSFLHFYPSDLTVDWEHVFAMIDIEVLETQVSRENTHKSHASRGCHLRHSRMISRVIRDAYRALRDRSTGGMLAGSMEENRRHTGG
ncbi:hypothetical protein T12_8529 [Trichinella patagoniensis]|uniref:Uncharacterized protein n=1 Tax=Trichinella patagoniensis TaxID=990121 RepID=A0A0V0ZJ24_9BILA|nr:hypothetical protein T12_8529 [Trichinella patagoniensis]